MRKFCSTAGLAVAFIIAATPAFAQAGEVGHEPFTLGFWHPLSGADHILAMIGVGLWAALLRPGAVLLVPVAFVATMLVGFALSLGGLTLPLVEPMMATSVIALGLLALAAMQAPTGVAMAMVGFFALFHGYAHGKELADAAALPYMVGFAAATILLHAVGVGFGIGAKGLAEDGQMVVRVAGGLTALTGVWLFV